MRLEDYFPHVRITFDGPAMGFGEAKRWLKKHGHKNNLVLVYDTNGVIIGEHPVTTLPDKDWCSIEDLPDLKTL